MGHYFGCWFYYMLVLNLRKLCGRGLYWRIIEFMYSIEDLNEKGFLMRILIYSSVHQPRKTCRITCMPDCIEGPARWTRKVVAVHRLPDTVDKMTGRLRAANLYYLLLRFFCFFPLFSPSGTLSSEGIGRCLSQIYYLTSLCVIRCSLHTLMQCQSAVH